MGSCGSKVIFVLFQSAWVDLLIGREANPKSMFSSLTDEIFGTLLFVGMNHELQCRFFFIV